MTQQPKKKGKKVLIGIGIFIGLGILGNLLPDPDGGKASSGTSGGKYRAMLAATTCESIIKRNLKNPPSFKRVDRELYSDAVRVTYRATNGFGGVITNTATCDVVGDTVTLRT
jgi:hypothetical protein